MLSLQLPEGVFTTLQVGFENASHLVFKLLWSLPDPDRPVMTVPTSEPIKHNLERFPQVLHSRLLPR
jgi:hypothetical protein